MKAPLMVQFMTRGYASVKSQLGEINNKLKYFQTSSKRVGDAMHRAVPKIRHFFNSFSTSGRVAVTAMSRFIGVIAKFSGAISGMVSGLMGASTALGGKFVMSMLKTTEMFRLNEISLKGVLKSAGMVKKISDWALKYAKEYPAMYKDIMVAMKGMAVIPTLKPFFKKGDVEMMERMMNVVQGLTALAPEQGVQGALFSLREFLSGQMRSMQFRFNIRPQDIAAAGGTTLEKMKKEPMVALKALKAFIDINVGADTLAAMARNLTTQVGNLKDTYEAWLKIVGDTGVYDKVVGKIIDLNDWWNKLTSGEIGKAWANKISDTLSSIVDKIQDVLTRGIDWAGILKSGDINAFVDAIKTIIDRIRNLFSDIWIEHGEQVKNVFQRIGRKAGEMFVWGFKEVFWPIFKSFMGSIWDAIKGLVKAHPFASGAGILGGSLVTAPFATIKGMGMLMSGMGKVGAITGATGKGAGWVIKLLSSLGLGGAIAPAFATAIAGGAGFMGTTGLLEITGIMDKIKNWAAGRTKIFSETPDQAIPSWGRFRQMERFTNIGMYKKAPPVKPPEGIHITTKDEIKASFNEILQRKGKIYQGLQAANIPLYEYQPYMSWLHKPPEWGKGYETEYARKSTLLTFGLPMERQLFQMRMQSLQRDIFEIWGPKEGKRMFAEEAQEKQAEFTEKVMGKWQELLTAQGVTAKDRAMIFQNLFKLAAPTGDIGKAETYYQKAMEELKKSFLKSAEKEKEKEKLDKERNETLNKVEKHLDNMQKSMKQKPPQNKDMEKPDTTDQEDV